MSNAKFDENRFPMGIGVSASDLSTPLPLLIDPVTGRLEIWIVPASDTTPTLPSGSAKRDDNRETVSSGLASAVPQDLLMDNRSGLLWADVEIET